MTDSPGGSTGPAGSGPAGADLVIAGLGPAGRALAFRAAAAGLDVTAVDPHPERVWTATYAAWADELPGWLPAIAVAAHVDTPCAWTLREHRIPRPYRVLDTAALQRALPLDRVRVVAARAVAVTRDAVVTADGRRLGGRCVVDARGLPATSGRAQQTAFGLVMDARAAAGALDGRDAWFMDWRRDNGTDRTDAPSFLYAVPVGPGQVLLEETCLVGRPALALPELERRLRARLEARGVSLSGAEPAEHVRFAVEGARRLRGGPVGFGARGGLMHPATGYAVATALSAADPVVAALQAGHAPDRVLWTPAARTVAALRAQGLRVLLGLGDESAAEFFAAFFALPVARQRAYLSGRADPLGVAAAMWALFGSVSPALRRAILRALF
ncbi:lycopene cyclase family protein [Rhodococcus zopfii]|uniref:lycopene cyclase family protein n=2 Tax=Rhodococcus zopfii TaxID=43772 RepID=UPI000933369F|nr:lycopene cyclase family protein [Rhodococcus zopfii]